MGVRAGKKGSNTETLGCWLEKRIDTSVERGNWARRLLSEDDVPPPEWVCGRGDTAAGVKGNTLPLPPVQHAL